MKKVILYTLLFLSLTSIVFAIDEGTYVHFVADSIITAHRLKGSPKAMELWADEMQKRYPDFMSQDWQAFEEKITKDSILKNKVYNKILENIISKGYNAHILDLGGGATTIEIED